MDYLPITHTHTIMIHHGPEGCEKLVSNFEAKKKARSQEIEALDAKKKALEL